MHLNKELKMENYVEIKSPFTGGKVKEVCTMEEHEFRKEHFSVHVRYYVCEDTGQRFTTTEQDELLFNELYSQYRVNHGIPFPEEIKSIRLHYGLNYQQITKILGFGVNQYAQYEKGQIPSESNGKLLSAIMNQQFMIHLLEDSRTEFTKDEYAKVLQSVTASAYKPENEAQKQLIYRNISRSIYNGFGQLNVSKVTEMVKFFISKEGWIFPTRLNKEMFYADFLHYKLHGQSISGLQYQAIQYGPVPVHYDTIYDNIDGINKKIVLAHDMESTRLSCSSYDDRVFNEQEHKTLSDVWAKIQPLKTQDLIKLSHNENAWKHYHEGNQLIPYSEAFSIHL
jgi:uncharacterized phage-associated protein